MTRARRLLRVVLPWMASGAIVPACTLERADLESAAPDRVHAAAFADAASPTGHVRVLRAARFAPMLDADDDSACARCHDGTPKLAPGVAFAAPGATACTSCHKEREGVLACSTCHRAGAGGARDGAHAAHLAKGLACASCHPAPSAGERVIGGAHGDGVVDVTIARPAGDGACAVACHDRGGARARPRWADRGPMLCGDCHASPPDRHPPGACASCHREPNASGTALTPGPLHGNGRVDVGDASGTCAACHGFPPATGAHAAHAAPSLAREIACATCHVVPTEVRAAGHLDGIVQVVLSGRARDRDAAPTWDGRSCAEVACHGAKLTSAPAVTPIWTDATGAARACTACHGVPPTQHSPSMSCERSTCHGDEVARSPLGVHSITPVGRALHVNGVIDAVH